MVSLQIIQIWQSQKRSANGSLNVSPVYVCPRECVRVCVDEKVCPRRTHPPNCSRRGLSECEKTEPPCLSGRGVGDTAAAAIVFGVKKETVQREEN